MQPASTISVYSKYWHRRASVWIILNVGVAIGGVLAARGLGTLTQVALARLMGVADFGVYTICYTLLGPVVMVASFGLDTWLLRQGTGAQTLDTTISQVFLIRFVATGGLMALAVTVVLVSSQTNTVVPVILAALGLTFELLLTTAYTALRVQMRNRAAACVQVVVAGLGLALIWMFWSQQAPLLVATGYRLVAAGVGVGLVIWLLWRSLRLMYWRLGEFVIIVRQAFPYFASDLLATVALKADLTLVALLLGAVGAGIYSPALTIVNTTFLVPMVAWQVLLPTISQYTPGTRAFRAIVGGALLGSVLYGLVWLLVLGWGADVIIRLVFHVEYMEAAPLLRVMSLIPLLKSINFCSAMLMVARDKQVLRTKLLAVSAIINVVANLICIPLFGLTGAAWINLWTEALLLVCYGYGAWMAVKQTS